MKSVLSGKSGVQTFSNSLTKWCLKTPLTRGLLKAPLTRGVWGVILSDARSRRSTRAGLSASALYLFSSSRSLSKYSHFA